MFEEFESMRGGHLGRTNVMKHRNTLLNDDVWPVHSVTYRAGPTTRKFSTKEITRMITKKVIKPAITEWADPNVFAPKKDGSLRFCVDYQELNAVIVHDPCYLPRMDVCGDRLKEESVFSTLNTNSEY